MCLAVYVASSVELTPSNWNEAAPSFYLESVPADDPVRKQFVLSNVYYAGSHEGCGCGFFKEDHEEDEDFKLRLENYTRLAQCTREALARGTGCQLFACWEGEQALEQKSVVSVSPNQLEAITFVLQQRQLVHVQPEA